MKSLGKPHEVIEADNVTLWIYDSSNGDVQRASLSFNQDRKLQSKAVMPMETEPEANVEFVLKSKFAHGQFISVRYPQCGMDYVSGSALYADMTAGVSIIYRKNRGEVEVIDWSTPAQLRQDIEGIKHCKRRGNYKQ